MLSNSGKNNVETESNDQEKGEDTATEEVPSGRHVTLESGPAYIQARLDTLQSMTSYGNKAALANIKGLGETYWSTTGKDRLQLGEMVVKHGFAEIAVKMLTYFNSEGVFSKDDVWFPTYYTLNTCWNYSDASPAVAKDLANKGLIKIIVANIRHKPYLENMSSKNVFYIVKASLSIIQNISKYPEIKPLFEEVKTVEALQYFTNASDDFLKTVALMAMTALISEDENATLTDTGAIPFMVSCIKNALANAKRRNRGFTPEELTVSLGRMAVNDNNKMKIVETGALPLFIKMLEHTDEDEQLAAGRAVWNLSFDEAVRQKIKDEPGLIDVLEKLAKNSDNHEVRKICKGALWVIEEKNKAKADEPQSGGSKTEKQIFISYNWGHQEVVLQIVEKLKVDGYKVWVDVDQMGGSTLEAMALGIENAYLVIVCMSEKYKLSPNCRTEAEYTFQLKKPMLPLMMQRHYKPDGWLGMLLGAKLYINMDGKHTFDHAYSMMVKEMNHILGTQVKEHIEVATAVGQTGSISLASDKSHSHQLLTDNSKIKKWNKEQVAHWLKENDLDSLKEKFSSYDGRLLCQLYRIKREAPEFYYKCLDTKMELDVLDLLRLTEALDSLLT